MLKLKEFQWKLVRINLYFRWNWFMPEVNFNVVQSDVSSGDLGGRFVKSHHSLETIAGLGRGWNVENAWEATAMPFYQQKIPRDLLSTIAERLQRPLNRTHRKFIGLTLSVVTRRRREKRRKQIIRTTRTKTFNLSSRYNWSSYE